MTREAYLSALARLCGGGVLSAVLAAAVPPPLATAQGLSGTAAEAARGFDIPAQSLTTALSAFGAQSGMRLAYDSSLAEGRRSPGVQGSMTPAEALGRLLAGTGLTWRSTGPSMITLLPQPTTSEATDATLPEVQVTGAAGNGIGPGYIARGSSAAMGTDTPLIETPQSLTVIPREQAVAQGAQTAAQSLRYAPGVSPEVRGSPTRFDFPYIRGFGSPTDPVLFMDGMRLLRGAGYAVPQVEMYLLDRVELLRGPSSVLYGLSTPGGLVNLVRRRPEATPSHEVELSYGTNNWFQAAADMTGPLDEEGHFLYRITGLYRQSDTDVNFTEQQRIAIAPQVTWRPDAATSLTLYGIYQHDPQGGYYGVLPTIGTVLPNRNGQIPRSFFEGDPNFDKFMRTMTAVGYEFRHDFDETWSIRQNLRYMNLEAVSDSVSTAGLAADQRTILRYAFGSREHFDGLVADTAAEARFTTGPLRHTALFGVDYQWMNWVQRQTHGSAPSIDFLNPVYGVTIPGLALITDQRQVIQQLGVYAQDQIRWDRLILTLSGRHDWVDATTDNRLRSTTLSQDDSAWSGRAGLLYVFDNGFAPYVTWSTSFLPVLGTDSAGDPFVPSTAQQVEAGLRYQPPGLPLMLSVAAFDITQTNVATYASATLRYQNGEVRSRGVELEARGEVLPGWNVTAAYTYLNAEVTRANNAEQGNRPIGVPAHTASLWSDYTIQDGPLAGLGFGAGVRWIGSTIGGYMPNAYVATAQRIDVPSYTLFDAMVRYDLGQLSPTLAGMEARVNGTNLGDKTYASCLVNNFCNYGAGRTVIASLRYRW